MARFFFILVIIGILVCGFPMTTSAMGLSDFVAVADSPTAAIYNPAGLINLKGKDFLIDHRFSGRDVSLGIDDLIVYTDTGQAGTGALFFGYSQDLLSGSYYCRDYSVGYAYGWQPSKQMSVGLSGKFGRYGIYNNYSGDMAEESSQGSFMIDTGLLLQMSNRTKIGFAVHNIGKDDSSEALNYESTLGLAYHGSRLTVAGEIYDLFDEGGTAYQGSLGRAGIRVAILPNLKIDTILEESIGDWNFSGKMFGLEMVIKQVMMTASWYQAEGDYISDQSWQAAIGYHF